MLLLPLVSALCAAAAGGGGEEGDACAAHADCAALHYCTKNEECAPCVDDEDEEPCELWGDSIDGSCASCGAAEEPPCAER